MQAIEEQHRKAFRDEEDRLSALKVKNLKVQEERRLAERALLQKQQIANAEKVGPA